MTTTTGRLAAAAFDAPDIEKEAAFYAGLVLEPGARDVAPPVESIDQLLDEAVACLDEHAVKTLEACLREYALNPNPVYLIAARETTRCLETNGLHLR